MNFDLIRRKQELFKETYGTYFQVRKGGKKNPKEQRVVDLVGIPKNIEIHEHICPDGEIGFTVVEFKTENGKEYRKATGRGCGSYSYDWQEIIKD